MFDDLAIESYTLVFRMLGRLLFQPSVVGFLVVVLGLCSLCWGLDRLHCWWLARRQPRA